MADVTIRRARAEDLEACHRIHGAAVRAGTREAYSQEATEAWASAFNRDTFPEKVEEDEVFVVENDERRVLGFVSLKVATFEVDSVYVDPAAAGRGIGTELLHHIMDVARQHHLHTLWLDASKNAVPFYEKRGWVETDRCTRVRDGVEIPCVRMERPVR